MSYQNQLLLEHRQVETGSPSVSYIEDYYLNHPERRHKVKEIKALSERQQDHILHHIAERLKRRRKTVPSKFLFAEFIGNPNVKKAENKRIRYFRDKNGIPHKQIKKTGRFASYSKGERRIIDKQAKLARQSQSNKAKSEPQA